MSELSPANQRPTTWYVLAAVGVILLYLPAAPPIYVLGDKLGIPDGPLEIFCLPYDWAEQHTPLQKPLGDYWFLWMQIGYGGK